MKRVKKAVVKSISVTASKKVVICPHCKTVLEFYGLDENTLRILCGHCHNPIEFIFKNEAKEPAEPVTDYNELVKELRKITEEGKYGGYSHWAMLIIQAADEIERLEKCNDKLVIETLKQAKEIGKLRAENKKLKGKTNVKRI